MRQSSWLAQSSSSSSSSSAFLLLVAVWFGLVWFGLVWFGSSPDTRSMNKKHKKPCQSPVKMLFGALIDLPIPKH